MSVCISLTIIGITIRKTSLSYMSYSPRDNAIMHCKVTFSFGDNGIIRDFAMICANKTNMPNLVGLCITKCV